MMVFLYQRTHQQNSLPDATRAALSSIDDQKSAPPESAGSLLWYCGFESRKEKTYAGGGFPCMFHSAQRRFRFPSSIGEQSGEQSLRILFKTDTEI